MKKTIQLCIAALTISIMISACSSDKKSDSIDTTLVDSSTIAPVANPTPVDTMNIDTVKKDSTKKP